MFGNTTKLTRGMTTRRLVAALLTLAMMITLTPASLAAGTPTVTPNKSDYYPGELMKFTLTNATETSGVAFVYKADGYPTGYNEDLDDFSGVKQVRLPEAPGSYELRIADSRSDDAKVLCTASFTVTKPPYRTDGKVIIEMLYLDNGRGYPEFIVNGPEELDGCAGMIMLKSAAINDSGYGYGTINFGIVETSWDRKPERPEDYELRIYTEPDSTTRKLLARQPLVFVPWSNASSWATGELKKADEAGLIPDILKGADLTRPITREEFAELAVLLYEKTTGQKATAASPNPFKDTTNPQILKAFKLGITTGTTATTFAPRELINREQVATMLSRALRVMAPGADFSTTGAPAFTDRKEISNYAVEHVLFMAKLEIIKGVDGKFMPKATTTAQKASGYATATREQSVAMSFRSYEKMDTIKASKGTAGAPEPEATPKNTPDPSPKTTPDTPKTPSSGGTLLKEEDMWLLETWIYSYILSSAGFVVLLSFNEDGTFDRALGSLAGYSYSSTAFQGKYRVTGDKIVLYDQKKSTAYASSWDELWRMANSVVKDIPVDDEEFTFSKSDEGNLILIDTNTGIENRTEYIPFNAQ